MIRSQEQRLKGPATGRTLFCAALALALAACPDTLEEPAAEGELLVRFAHITDAQICDEESPARAVRFDPVIPESWRPQEAYAAQVLDATLAVLNRRHGETPIDFAVHTGDAVELGQFNEVRWFIDVMDGQWVVPDSGALDGAERPLPPELNPKLGFQAQGIAPDIPWYSVHGNHDSLAVGNFHLDQRDPDPVQWTAPIFAPVAAIIGLHAFEDRPNALWPADDRSPAVITGRREPPMNPETLRLRLRDLRPGAITPDAARHFTGRHGFIEEHFHTVTTPKGHGFTEANRRHGHAYYSAWPREDAPVRLIVLDTVSPVNLPGWPMFYGVLPRSQFEDFLKPELQAAKEAGEYAIIASHHPSRDFNLPHPGATVPQDEFRAYLARQPHVIAHVCGHSHRNHAEKHAGPYPYLEIETGSLIDYPQEGRIIEVRKDPESGRIRVDSTMFSHREDPSLLSAESFRRAVIDAQTRWRKAAENGVDPAPLPDPRDAARHYGWPKGAEYELPEDPFAAAPGPYPPWEARGRTEDRDFRIYLDRHRGRVETPM